MENIDSSAGNITQEVTEEISKGTTSIMTALEQIDWNQIIANGILTLIKIIFILIILFGLYKIINHSIHYFFRRFRTESEELPPRFNTIQQVAINAVIAVFTFLAFYFVLSMMNFPIGSLLAGAGVIGLALSLGAQGFVNDLINGLKVLFEGQMSVGDSVVFPETGIAGTVKNITLTTTEIQGFDGSINFVPNREIIVVTNKSRNDMRVLIEIPLYPNTDFESVRKVIDHVNDQLVTEEKTITKAPNTVSFIPAIGSSVPHAQVIMYAEPGDMFRIRNIATELYYDALQAEGIELPVLYAI